MSTTPKNIKKITDAPDGDATIADDDDVADIPNTADDDAESTDSKNNHISLETAIMPPMILLMMLSPPMILNPPTLS